MSDIKPTEYQQLTVDNAAEDLREAGTAPFVTVKVMENGAETEKTFPTGDLLYKMADLVQDEHKVMLDLKEKAQKAVTANFRLYKFLAAAVLILVVLIVMLVKVLATKG